MKKLRLSIFFSLVLIGGTLFAQTLKTSNLQQLTGIQKNINRFESKQLAAKKNIYKVYLDLITNSPVMIKEPRINFLSDNLNLIK
jgi:hypothetical protein